jgi:c(7)-type cytochrome triheme protein
VGEELMKARIYILITLFICFLLSIVYAETFGVKQRRSKPHEYGNVLIDKYSLKKQVPPVVFKHWLHRAKYTCRLCHVDIGFGMKAKSTEILCEDIENEIYCGSCHNGEDAFARIEITPDGKTVKNCKLCHSHNIGVKFKHDFYKFRKKMPKERFGNGMNWEEAEERKLIEQKDFIEGISIRRKELKKAKELQFSTGEMGMPDIIFSHKKHTIWSGCELCHPEIFGVKPGETVYSMQDIFNGLYCGSCHGSVAFPNNDCQRCHTKMVY